MKPYVLKISKSTKRIHLQRFLVSKLLYFGEMEEKEIIALFDNQLWLEGKALKDSQFFRKFGRQLDCISFNLKNLNLSNGLSLKALRRMAKRITNEIPDFIIPHRNLESTAKTFERKLKLLDSEGLGVPKKFLPAKKIIGKGYTDKGTLKDLATDGSPRWSEIYQDTTINLENQEKLDQELRDVLSTCKNSKELIGLLSFMFQVETEPGDIRRGEAFLRNHHLTSKKLKRWYQESTSQREK